MPLCQALQLVIPRRKSARSDHPSEVEIRMLLLAEEQKKMHRPRAKTPPPAGTGWYRKMQGRGTPGSATTHQRLETSHRGVRGMAFREAPAGRVAAGAQVAPGSRQRGKTHPQLKRRTPVQSPKERGPRTTPKQFELSVFSCIMVLVQ